ncbi:MAG: hypothetical protein P9M03_11745 [Candidatus Theseobacter exili]|nr:hypothetical protein [Candidatus Theseobacter exili]
MKSIILCLLLGIVVCMAAVTLSGCTETSPYQQNSHLGYGM